MARVLVALLLLLGLLVVGCAKPTPLAPPPDGLSTTPSSEPTSALPVAPMPRPVVSSTPSISGLDDPPIAPAPHQPGEKIAPPPVRPFPTFPEAEFVDPHDIDWLSIC